MRSSSAWVLQLVLFSMIARRWAEEYPEPRIVAVGATGVGKSSLVNALLGCDPRGSECLFGVCGGTDSCTNQTAIGSGPWLGDGADFTAVDTPGFGDSSGSDNKLIEEMMDVLDGKLGYANAILLVLEGSTPRFSSGLYDMLRVMTSIFGDSWWQFMLIGVSKWPYDQASIDKRQGDCDYYGDPSENCKNEAWFRREFNRQLQDKFGITKNFTFAFMDSYSQSGPELGDEVQQQHWQDETQLLWDHATLNDDTFEFLTIDEVLEENQLCKEENQRLHNIIDENITLLFNYVQANADQISTTQEELSLIDIKVDINMNDIDALETVVDKIKGAPLGTILAWVSKPVNDTDEYADIPDGWQVCDGSTIPHGPSIWAGKKVPDLNSEGRFLRGGVESQMLTLENDQLQDHTHYYTDPGHDHDYTDPGHDHDYTDPGHDHDYTDPGHDHDYTDPGHDHDYTDPGHTHKYTDPGHNHDYTDPGHDHDYTDPGHVHEYKDTYTSWAEIIDGYYGPTSADKESDRFDQTKDSTSSNTKIGITIEEKKTGIIIGEKETGITIEEKKTGITIGEKKTGITIEEKKTGITIEEKKTGITIDEKKSGITVTSVNSGHHGPETRPINMRVIYIMRIY